MLEGLDKVDWSKWHHAYGPAVDVPPLLRALADPEGASEAIRQKAAKAKRPVFDHVCWELWGNVFHQGSRWQASAKVVPFLVEILREGPDRVELKRFLVSYLHHLAMGYPADVFPEAFDPSEEFRTLEGQVDPGGEPDLERAGIWVRDCYEAVETALDPVLRFLEAPDEKLAVETIALATWFPRRRESVAPHLLRIARGEKGLRSGTALVSLAHLAPGEAKEPSLELLRSHDPIVALHAACARVISGAAPLDEETVTVLVGSPVDGKLHTPLANNVESLIGRCLALLPPHHLDAAMGALATRLPGSPPLAALSLSGSLLRLMFGEERAPARASELSPLQRRGVEALRDHGPFRVGNSIFANYSQLLRNWGLPGEKTELAAWLAG